MEMSRPRDSWVRLVEAVVKRQQIWEMCHDDSRSPSTTTLSSNSNDQFLANISAPNSESESIFSSTAVTIICSRDDSIRKVAHSTMARLEEEFKHLLVQNRQPFKLEHMTFCPSEDDCNDGGLGPASGVVSSGDPLEGVVRRDSMVSLASEKFLLELGIQDVIQDLKSIVNLIFDSNYGMECVQVFVDVQKAALDDCLFFLEVEILGIEDVLNMDRSTLSLKIRRWIRAAKLFVRFYLASAKLLMDQVFGDLESASSVCFVESSKSAIQQLLSFCEAIAFGPHQPEKLFWILDMCELLEDLIPDLWSLYCDESGSAIRTECQFILKRLLDCAKATFLEFENSVASSVSTNAMPGGGIHPLTRYVMNYIIMVIVYSDTLNSVLKDQDVEDPVDMGPVSEDENANGTVVTHPMAIHLSSFISILENNLHRRSKLYKKEPLQHLFLMNNVCYIVQKVKISDLRSVLGDDWIRSHKLKCQQHEMSYQRATWSSVIALLKFNGIHSPGSSSISRAIIKGRLQSFYVAFEEVYNCQTGWLIPDALLRDEILISTVAHVILAYRSFVGMYVHHIREKHIKYSADDLEIYLLDLFQGSPKSLHGSHKK